MAPPRARPNVADVIVISSPSSSSSPKSPPPDLANDFFDDGDDDIGFFLPDEDEGRVIAPDVEMQQEQPLPQEQEIISPDQCLAYLLTLFPDIDHGYVGQLYEQHFENFQFGGANMIDFLANQVLETNGHYPKSQREDRSVKRKRERSPSEMTAQELENKYCNDPTRAIPSIAARSLSAKLLRNAFPLIPAAYIDQELLRSQFFIFGAFQALAHAESRFEKEPQKPFKKLTRVRKAVSDEVIAQNGNELRPEEHDNLMVEFRAAKRIYEAITFKGNPGGAGPAGSAGEELVECGCCFGEVPFTQLTQCKDGHLFCLECGMQNAKTEIGQQRYKLVCMDGSGCKKEFSPQEIKRFCDEKMLEALEKLEQRDMLREAGIEDLEECPFCDFALIMHSSVEDDKEFRCQGPECGKVSCRVCKKLTHIPLSCEESAKDEKQNLRKGVEEAMTEALLRKCGKCSLPYVKESGCNKIVCSRCHAMNCYLCSKVIKDYHHFNDPARGGRTGNCLLFDNTDERHHNEVHAAEEAAIAKIRAENPEITEEQMRIQLSQVIIDEERQKIEEGNRRLGHNHPGAGARPPGLNALPPRFQGRHPQIVPPFIPGPNGRHVQPEQQLPQVNPLPYFGNPVPFQGFPINQPQQAPPVGFIQRFLDRRQPRFVIPQQQVVVPAPMPAPIPQPILAAPHMDPEDDMYRGVLQGVFNRYGMGIANQANQPARAQAQPQPNANLGFIDRNFGGNRLVARARQPIRINRGGRNAQPVVDNGVNNVAAAHVAAPRAAAPGGIKQAPVPDPPIPRRPAKIAKRK
ncbi:hypothetical protein TWF481_012055 [Arthrobotrys musiformis]|uniref:RING-type domain-containing protein n=1 Tax=Arthrobotrys musiformis TaxID=47236 RepID=A0AAV9VYD9_9PEZI